MTTTRDITGMRDELLKIDGVGPATSEEIMNVVEENTEDSEGDEEDTEDANPWLDRAYEALENGDEDAALTYLNRSK